MKAKTLKNKKKYTVALERFENIFQANPGTKESDEADALALLIKDYEDPHFFIPMLLKRLK